MDFPELIRLQNQIRRARYIATSKAKANYDKYYAENGDRIRAKNRANYYKRDRVKHAEKVRREHLWRTYRMTLDDYNRECLLSRKVSVLSAKCRRLEN